MEPAVHTPGQKEHPAIKEILDTNMKHGLDVCGLCGKRSRGAKLNKSSSGTIYAGSPVILKAITYNCIPSYTTKTNRLPWRHFQGMLVVV